MFFVVLCTILQLLLLQCSHLRILRICERKGCCISVNLRLKVRISCDQKHSNTIVEWPKRHGMLHYCEFAIESTDFPCPKALKYHSGKWG